VDLLSPAVRMQAANAKILARYRCLAETVSGDTNKEILKAIPRPAGKGRERCVCFYTIRAGCSVKDTNAWLSHRAALHDSPPPAC
jgi:hypothetical protein